MAVLNTGTNTYITDISNILKKVIAPKIQEVLPTATVWYSMLQKNSGVTAMSNNTFYVTLRTGRHSGIASVAEGATLPTGKPKFSQTSVAAKYIFGTFDITDQVLESAKDNAGALANYMTLSTQALKTDFGRELNRIFWGYGNGQLTTVNGSGTGTTLTVNSSSPNGDIKGTKYLSDGMNTMVDVENVRLTTVLSDTTITTPSFTYAADEVVKKADGDGAAVDEPMGIDGVVDDGTLVPTFQGITRSASPWFNAAYIDTASEALGLSKMEAAYTAALEFGNPKYVFMNKTLWKKYGTLLETYKKTANLTEVLSGGWKGLDFMGGQAAVMLDFDCPDGKVFFIDPDSVTIGQLAPISWVDRGDGVLRRVDYASWQGVLKWYGNLIALNPRANAKLTAKTGA